MAAKIIRFFPRYPRKEAKASKEESLINTAWKLAYCPLWAEQSFAQQQEGATRDYIRECFTVAIDTRRAFIALIQPIIRTQNYLIRSADRYLPSPPCGSTGPTRTDSPAPWPDCPW